MQPDALSKNSNFVVKESIAMNLIIATVLLCMAITVFAYDTSSSYTGFLFVVPSLFFVIKGLRNKAVMRINSQGIYLYNNLLTNWQFFKTAYLKELPMYEGETEDYRFFLFIQFYKTGETGFFEHRFSITDTQDQSEDDILAAINRFYELSQKVQTAN